VITASRTCFVAMASPGQDLLVVHQARFLDFKPKRVTSLSVSPSSKLVTVAYSTAEVVVFRIVDSAHIVPVLVSWPHAEIAMRHLLNTGSCMYCAEPAWI